jgi:hypothetical protein
VPEDGENVVASFVRFRELFERGSASAQIRCETGHIKRDAPVFVSKFGHEHELCVPRFDGNPFITSEKRADIMYRKSDSRRMRFNNVTGRTGALGGIGMVSLKNEIVSDCLRDEAKCNNPKSQHNLKSMSVPVAASQKPIGHRSSRSACIRRHPLFAVN